MSSNSSSNKTLNCFGIGCMVAIGIPVLVGLATSGSFGPLLVVALIVTVVVLAVRSQNKKLAQYTPPAFPAPSAPMASRPSTVPAPITSVTPSTTAPVTAGRYATGICAHSFTDVELQGQTSVTCACGYTYPVSLLKDYSKLNKQLADTKSKLDGVTARLQEIRRNGFSEVSATPAWTPSTSPAAQPKAPVAAAKTSAASTISAPIQKPAAQSKPIKPVVKRRSVTVSAQQWLIIGASILVMVASTIFVSANLSTLSTGAFLAITAGVALVTGFVAIWGRKISVLLANFMALFSTAMQIASVLLIGVLTVSNGDWAWNSAPAWWWGVDLAIVSGLSYALTRFKRNFGWSVASLVSVVAAALLINFGVLQQRLDAHQFGWFGAVTTVAAVALALVAKSVKNLKFELPENKDDQAYEKDLHERETAAIQRFTLASATLLSLTGIGYLVYGLINSLFTPIDSLSLGVFTLVWIGAGAIQQLWVPELATSKKLQEQINSWQHIIGFTSVALTLESLFPVNTDLWISGTATAALAFVAVALERFVKRVGAHPIAIASAQYALLGSWIVWNLIGLEFNLHYLQVGSVFVMFALSLLWKHWLKDSTPSAISAMVLHVLGILVIVTNLRISRADRSTGIFALEVLLFTALTVLYSPVLHFVSKKHKSELPSIWHWVVFALSGLTSLTLVAPGGDRYAQTAMLPLIITMIVSSAVTQWLALSGRVDDFRTLLLGYSGLFQVLTLLALFGSVNSVEHGFTAAVLLALGLVNYALALLGRFQPTAHLGYALILVASAIELFNLNTSPLLGLALAAGGVAALNLLNKVTIKRAGGVHLILVSVVTTVAFTALSVGLNFSDWIAAAQDSSANQTWGVLELAGISLAFAGWAERKSTRVSPDGTLLRIGGLTVAVLNFFSLATLSADNRVWTWHHLIASTVFAVIALRQLVAANSVDNAVSSSGWFALSYAAPIVMSSEISRLMYLYIGDLNNPWMTEIYSLPLVVALAVPAFMNRKLSYGAKPILRFDVPVLIPVLMELGKGLMVGVDSGMHRIALSLVVLAGFTLWRSMAEKRTAWMVVGYLSTLFASLASARVAIVDFKIDWNGPEIYTVPLALAIVIGNFFLVRRVVLPETTRAVVRFDLPVLIPVVSTIAYAAMNIPSNGSVRLTLALLVLTAFSYWRSVAEQRLAWVMLGYAGGLFTAVSTAWLILGRLHLDWKGPELYSVLISLSLVAGAIFLRKRVELSSIRSELAAIDIPVVLPVAIEIFYALANNPQTKDSLWRLLVSFGIVFGYGVFKIGRGKLLAWAVLAYAAIVGVALTGVALIYAYVSDVWTGPEIYAIAAAVAIVVGNRELSRIVKFSSSIFTWGLPLGALVLPSVVYSLGSVALPFDQLTSTEIARIISVLVIATAALVLGMRQGNLGATVVGGASLALTIIPMAWMRAGETGTADNTLSLRALIVGVVLFAMFVGLRRANVGPDSSYFYLGIPFTVALAPSIYLTISALNNPQLTTVDWWRFSLIIAVSLTLLIVGALRELGGLFFPGLAGVLVAVLPYAFKPIASQGWFLWVLLLVIAGVMVWIAVRLEQMRKLGKSSVSWVKSLH